MPSAGDPVKGDQQLRVSLNGPQLLAATGILLSGEIETLLRCGVPVEAAIDLLIGAAATLVARIDSPVLRTQIAARLTNGFESIVRAKEIEVRTTPGGVYMPGVASGKPNAEAA